MNTSSGQRRLLPLALTPLAILLAGCGPTTSGSNTSQSTGTPQAVDSPSASTTPRPSTPASAAVAASSRRCHTDQLRVAVTADPAGGAAGSYGLRIVFTNAGAGSCTMYGFPSVSFMTGSRGHPVNSPAKRSTGSPKTVTLAPGGRAHALLLMVQAGNYQANACHPVTTGGFRIYPPDEVTPLYAVSSQQVCSTTGAGLATINPVTS